MGKKNEETYPYDDIINLPHPVSAVHPQMAMAERAAQFSPFAALTGYRDAIEETARLTDGWTDLDEGSRESLDRKLAFLMEYPGGPEDVTITYFQLDERKAGGAYRSVSGRIKKIDGYERRLVMADGKTIPMEYIIEIESPCLKTDGL